MIKDGSLHLLYVHLQICIYTALAQVSPCNQGKQRPHTKDHRFPMLKNKMLLQMTCFHFLDHKTIYIIGIESL